MRWQRSVGLMVISAALLSRPVQSAEMHPLAPSPSPQVRPRQPPAPPTTSNLACATATELKPLVAQMLLDLPSYANRANTRLGLTQNYVIVASRPDFQPLPLKPEPLRSDSAALPPRDRDPYQVFFTTLSRRYQDNQPVAVQEFHWLFLTQSESGWRLAFMYSMLGSYPNSSPPTPPRESSNGSIAQAIRAWLRDCRLGG